MKHQWVDGPFPLIETPWHKLAPDAVQSTANIVATDMAQAHNVMIRGVNSMLIQAPLISNPTDIQDFINYAMAFCVVIHEHHNTEEVLMFPMLEDMTGVVGVMDHNVVQHEAFLPKLHDFRNYVSQIKLGVKKYDAEKLVALLNAFAGLMVRHLTDEVAMLVDMEKYDIDWKAINEKIIKHAVETADRYQELPFVLCNMDITFENNMHVGVWPPIPWIAQLYFRWFYAPKYKGAWRFGSCDLHGRPKELEFAPTI